MKLNSLKTYNDKWILVCLGMILAYFLMLLPLCWGWSINEEEKSEWEREPWVLNEEQNQQEMPILTESESHQRFIELANKYNPCWPYTIHRKLLWT